MAWRGEFAPQFGTPYGMHKGTLAGVAVGVALQRAALGRAGGIRSEDRQAAVGDAFGQHGRGRAAGIDQLRRAQTATAGGLIFTAAALDPHLHAFDADTGKEVWQPRELPASAQSTPMTYQWEGRQYIVVCAGGHGKTKSKMGICGGGVPD